MKYKINLLLPKEKNWLDRIIYFGLNYLRYILVITQTVIILVFFYRFKVDQEIVDLKDSVKQKQEIIIVSKPLLDEASKLIQVLDNAQIISDNQNHFQSLFSYFINSFPKQITLNKLQINQNGIEFEGVTQDIKIVHRYQQKILSEGKFKKINLKQIKKIENGFLINFSLTEFKS